MASTKRRREVMRLLDRGELVTASLVLQHGHNV